MLTIREASEFLGVSISRMRRCMSDGKKYEEELVEDVVSVIIVFSSKLYGSKSYKYKKIKDINLDIFNNENIEDRIIVSDT